MDDFGHFRTDFDFRLFQHSPVGLEFFPGLGCKISVEDNVMISTVCNLFISVRLPGDLLTHHLVRLNVEEEVKGFGQQTITFQHHTWSFVNHLKTSPTLKGGVTKKRKTIGINSQ